MSDLFNIYEDSLNGLLNRIRNVTDTFNNLSKGKIPQLIKDKAEYALIEANNSIKDADRLIKQMNIECSANKGSSILSMKFRNYSNEFEVLKKVFYKLQDNYVTQKSQDALLLGAEERKIGDTGGHQRDKLIENEEIAWNQFNKLENAKRTLAGTESISLNVMRDLHHQGNQMKNISVKISDMNQQMEDSSDLMVKMERRNRRIRIYIYVFSGVLALVGFIILLFKAFNI